VSEQVVRVWKGYGSAAGIQRYCDEHFRLVVLPQLRALDGFVGATVLARTRERDAEVVVTTRWDSIEAIRGFAGEDYECAVVEPAVRDLLDSFDERVEHLTVIFETDAQGRGEAG
jgi:heme-degrading monooxygenase HmoA